MEPLVEFLGKEPLIGFLVVCLVMEPLVGFVGCGDFGRILSVAFLGVEPLVRFWLLSLGRIFGC